MMIYQHLITQRLGEESLLFIRHLMSLWRFFAEILLFDRKLTSEEDEKIEGYRPGMEAKVTTGGIPIKKMHRVRLGEAIEFVKPELDVTVTGDLTQTVMDVLLWDLS